MLLDDIDCKLHLFPHNKNWALISKYYRTFRAHIPPNKISKIYINTIFILYLTGYHVSIKCALLSLDYPSSQSFLTEHLKTYNSSPPPCFIFMNLEGLIYIINYCIFTCIMFIVNLLKLIEDVILFSVSI